MELPSIEQLNLQASPAEIEEWVERFELWSSIRKDVKKENQAVFFLTAGGRDLYSLMKNLAFPRLPAELPFDELKRLLLQHVLPVNFQATERAKFNTLVRSSSTSCREFILQLQKQASRCNFGEKLEENLRDRLIAGINNSELQRKLLDIPDLTFAKARDICERRDDVLAATTENAVLLTKQSKRMPTCAKSSNRPQSSPEVPVKPKGRCWSCGGLHLRSTCKLRNAVCHGCGKTGHIKKVCRASKCHLTKDDQPVSDADSPIYTLHTLSGAKRYIVRPLTFQSGVRKEFIVDTGSWESIIPISDLQTVAPQCVVNRTSVVLQGITGDRLKLLGECTVPVKREDGFPVPIRFLVSECSPSILGLEALRKLEVAVTLATKQTEKVSEPACPKLQALIAQCSNNRGGMKVKPARLETEGDPVFLKRRVLPYGIRDCVCESINRMEREGALTRVDSSAWATPIVVARKSDGNTPRICGDYRLTLNPRLRRCATTTEEPEDVMKSLQGSCYYSKIDLANAYLQIPLEPESKALTTINTPWGLYQYNFLPFGLHVSPGIFQTAIDGILDGIDGVRAYQDDVIVFGRTKEEHDRRLLAVLQRFAEANVSIKPAKCLFQVTELEFLGFTISAAGYRPDPNRFRSLVEAESPKNKDHLRSIMGCLQYYSRFIPNFATRAHPLFELRRRVSGRGLMGLKIS